MLALERFLVTFGRPGHGWLPFRLEIGELVLEDTASSILNDPVADWLGLLECSLRPTIEPARVCLWLEPDG